VEKKRIVLFYKRGEGRESMAEFPGITKAPIITVAKLPCPQSTHTCAAGGSDQLRWSRTSSNSPKSARRGRAGPVIQGRGDPEEDFFF